MLWQSYPIFWLVMGLLVAVLFFRWMYHRTHWTVIARTDGRGIPYKRKWFYVSAVLLVIFVYGSASTSSLKWKKAFELNDNFKSYLSLNPLQNFFTTLRFRRPQFNENKARENFPVMADWMSLPDKEKFSYRREIFPETKALESKPNVVLVMCESFSMYKSSMSGNVLNSTPYFNSMADSGIFFEKCFTPHFSTARGLFALLTGIPDVQLSKFSTRKDGIRSLKSRSVGLNAKYVANLNTVKMSKKMSNRLMTHKIVFGIFSLISIANRKRKAFPVHQQSVDVIILPVPLFLSNVFA